jgi:TM2 domain-containing membrane protein YozV
MLLTSSGKFQMKQIGEGLTTTLFWWLTIHQNVDWMNDIYYIQQRYVNDTGDAVKRFSDQLSVTSLMTW